MSSSRKSQIPLPKQKSVKNLMRLTRRLHSERIELTLDLRPLLKYAGGEAGMVANMAV